MGVDARNAIEGAAGDFNAVLTGIQIRKFPVLFHGRLQVHTQILEAQNVTLAKISTIGTRHGVAAQKVGSDGGAIQISDQRIDLGQETKQRQIDQTSVVHLTRILGIVEVHQAEITKAGLELLGANQLGRSWELADGGVFGDAILPLERQANAVDAIHFLIVDDPADIILMVVVSQGQLSKIIQWIDHIAFADWNHVGETIIVGSWTAPFGAQER